MSEFSKVISSGIAWSVILFPIALFLLIQGVPHILDALGWLFWLMREFADAVRG